MTETGVPSGGEFVCERFCTCYYLVSSVKFKGYSFIFVYIKTYLYRVVHNQTILILFYCVALFLAKSTSRDN